MTTIDCSQRTDDSPVRDVARASREEGARLLTASAALVARGWCQGALAIDDGGRRVEPWSDDARRWSPLGALLRAWYESSRADVDAFRLAYGALATATGGRLEEWNTARWRTHRHVLSAFGRARIGASAPSDALAAELP